MLPITIDVEDTKLTPQVSKTKIKDLLGSVVRLILSDSDSRNLFLFLLLNLTFGFVELFYGIMTTAWVLYLMPSICFLTARD